MKNEILIAEDERALREGMKGLLSGEGYEVRTARDGEDALAKIAERRPNLVLLDVMMPKMNGFRCCEEIRKDDALLPVVFLTAKDSEADQVRGLGLGADAYVAKETGEALLLAFIRRALERAVKMGELAVMGMESRLCLGKVTVDLKAFSVVEGGKEIARLTKSEADVLRILNSQRGEIIVPDDIITELRGNGFACEDGMLYSHIFNLRKKLGPAADMIVNKRGVGYGLKLCKG